MTVRLRDMSIPIHSIRFNLGFFYIGLQARLKIGIHLLSNRSPDGIRTLAGHRSASFLAFSYRCTCFSRYSMPSIFLNRIAESYNSHITFNSIFLVIYTRIIRS